MSMPRTAAMTAGFLLFFGACLLCLSATIDCGLSLNDEGLILYGADRILDGDVPYRDFWSIYSPGQFYVVALILKACERSILSVRYYSLLIQFALVLAAYLLARRLVGRGLALFSAGVIAVNLASVRFWASPVPPAILFSLLTGLLLSRLFERGGRFLAFLSGVTCGMVALFRHDFGGYMLLCTVVVFVILASFRGGKDNPTQHATVRQAAAYTFYHILGIMAICVPAALSLIASVPWDILKSDLIDFPADIFPSYRRLPFPAPLPEIGPLRSGVISPGDYVTDILRRLPYYLPVIAAVGCAAVLIVRKVRNSVPRPAIEIQTAILLLLMCLVFFNQARVRSDFSHVVPALAPATIILVYLVKLAWAGSRPIARVMTAGVLVGIAALATLPAVQERSTSIAVRWSEQPELIVTSGPAQGIRLYRGHERYFEALKYVADRVPPQERIFVGSEHHDRIAANDMMFYFLSRRRCASRYHELSPGLVTTSEVQNSIIDDLERHRVKFIVLAELGSPEPNLSSVSSGVTLLDDYIRSRFGLDTTFDRHSIWQRLPVSALRPQEPSL